MTDNIKMNKLLCFAIMLLAGCSSLNKSTITTGKSIKDIAMQNAIMNFSTNCNLFKRDSIFDVSFEDSVFNEGVWVRINEKIHEHGATHIRKRGLLYDGIVTVTISAHRICMECDECTDKFLYTAKTTVGSKGSSLPTRYIEKDGKLFYWWDDDYPLTEEMLTILWKYNLICDDTVGLIGIPDFSTDDSQKAAHYYFCKNDLSKYKRIITNIATGYYKPPKLKCK